MSDRDAYVAKMKSQLDEWNAEIDKLQARARGAEADARIQYDEQVAELKKYREQAESDLERLRKAGDDAWDDMKTGLENAWKSMEGAMRSARSRFD